VLAALAASACISAPVSYAAPPDLGAPHIPWIHAGPVVGYLFYYGAPGPWKTQTNRVLVTPGGGITGQYATKILWHVRGGSLRTTITGQRLDAVGHFKEAFPSVGGGYYPSIIDVPSQGCWRITVSSGRRLGRFAFVALAS
jgi:hypothetical protein